MYVTYKRIKLDPCLTLYIIIYSKWTIDLNVKVTTITFLGENTSVNFQDLGLDGCLDMTPKAQAAKEEIDISVYR